MDILNTIGPGKRNVKRSVVRIKKVKISETMRKDPDTYREVDGLWEESTGSIIIKRSTLKNLAKYSGTLIHETGHCNSRSKDITREFELELTRIIGILVSKLFYLLKVLEGF